MTHMTISVVAIALTFAISFDRVSPAEYVKVMNTAGGKTSGFRLCCPAASCRRGKGLSWLLLTRCANVLE